MKSQTDQEPPALSNGGIANTSIWGIPLYTVIGIFGVSLELLSLIIPCSTIFIRYYPIIFDLLTLHRDLILWVIIGIVGSIISLLFKSWKNQVVSGAIFLIMPIVFIPSWQVYQLSWFVVAFLGGSLMIIGGLVMRTAASYVTYP